MRAFHVVELLDYDDFIRREAYDPFTIYYWPIPSVQPDHEDVEPWSPQTDYTLGGAVTLDFGPPLMLMSPRLVQEIVERQGFSRGSSGGGTASKILHISGIQLPDSSGMYEFKKLKIAADGPYADYIRLDSNDHTCFVLTEGQIVTINGIINASGFNSNNGNEGNDYIFTSWNVSATIAVTVKGDVVVLQREITPHFNPTADYSEMPFTIDLVTGPEYLPTEEEIGWGMVEFPAYFALGVTSLQQFYGESEFTGELTFTVASGEKFNRQ